MRFFREVVRANDWRVGDSESALTVSRATMGTALQSLVLGGPDDLDSQELAV